MPPSSAPGDEVGAPRPDRQVMHLLVRLGDRVAALRAGDVVETMRPLPVAPLAGQPSSVRGAAVVRGKAIPVVDLAALLGAAVPASGGEKGRLGRSERFVVVRTRRASASGSSPAGSLQGEDCRPVALAVDEVLGTARLGPGEREGMPPLLQGAAQGAVEELSSRDGELLVVLRAACLLPKGAGMGAVDGGLAKGPPLPSRDGGAA